LTLDELETFALTADQGFLFAAIPENKDALDLIEQRFPGGTRNSVARRALKPEVLYYAYVLPPE